MIVTGFDGTGSMPTGAYGARLGSEDEMGCGINGCGVGTRLGMVAVGDGAKLGAKLGT